MIREPCTQQATTPVKDANLYTIDKTNGACTLIKALPRRLGVYGFQLLWLSRQCTDDF